MDALNNIKLTAFQQAASIQEDAALSQLDYATMAELFKYIIYADANTEIGNACKMTQLVFQDLTSLEIALEKSDFMTIKGIISIISATDPKNAPERLLKILEKVSAHAAKEKTPNLTLLLQILALPNLRKLLSSPSKMIDHDLGELLAVLIQANHWNKKNPTKFIEKLIRQSIIKGKVNIFKALICNAHIHDPQMLCNSRSLFRATSQNNLEMVKLIVPHYIPSNQLNEKNQLIMQKAVINGFLEVAKFLEEKSIGNLNLAISSDENSVSTSMEMLQFALTRTHNNGRPLVTNQHLNCVINYSLFKSRPDIAKIAYKILLERNAQINFSDFIESAINPENGNRNNCLGFAYTLLQDYEDKFGKTGEWGNLASFLLYGEILSKNYYAAIRLLDDPLINISAHSLAPLITKIEMNEANKDKWLEVLRKTIFHPNFTAYPHEANIVRCMRPITTSKEVTETLDFYLNQSKLIDFDYIASGFKRRKM